MNRLKKKMQFRRLVFTIGLACVALVVGVAGMIGLLQLHKAQTSGFGACAALPLLGVVSGAAMTDDEFRQKVLGGVESIQKKNEELTTNFGNLQKETKTAIEDLTKIKNTCNDQATVMAALQKVLTAMKMEQRLAFGDPVARLVARENVRDFINAAVRRMVFGKDAKLPEHLQKALTGEDAGLGQALVPQETAAEIYDVLASYGRWSTLGVRNVGARTEVLPIATSRPVATWFGAGTGGTGEGDAGQGGAKAGGSVSLLIQTLMVLLSVSEEEIQDATVDVSAVVLNDFIEACNFGLDFAAFTANGSADVTDAGYYGIFEAGTINTNCKSVAAAGNVTVDKLDLEDFVRCLTTVSDGVLQRPAKWWAHPKIIAKMLLVRDAAKRPIFQTMLEAPAPGGIGSILGSPVIPVSAAPNTDAAGAKVAVFGDPRGQVIGLRRAFEFAESEHVGFTANLRWFRGKMRAGVKMRIPTGNPATHVPFAVLTLPNA